MSGRVSFGFGFFLHFFQELVEGTAGDEGGLEDGPTEEKA